MDEKKVELTFNMVKELMFNRAEYPKERFDEYRRAVTENLEEIRKELYKRKRPVEAIVKPVKETQEEIENWEEI